MLSELIRGYAEQLEEIHARETTTEKLLRSIGEEQEEELTGAYTVVVERRQACRQRSDLPKQCAGEEEERWRRR
jgi:hypothetical protein